MGRKLVLKGTKLTDTTAPVLVSLLAADDFNRADGAPGVTPAGGLTWTALTDNPWTIATNTLAAPATISSASTGAKYAVNVGASNVYAEAKFSGGDWGVGLMVRATQTGAGYVLIHNSNTVELRSIPEAGGSGTLLTSWSPGIATTYTFGLRAVGSTITAYRNGTTLGSFTDSTHTGTWAGVRAQTTGRTADDFRVTTAA